MGGLLFRQLEWTQKLIFRGGLLFPGGLYFVVYGIDRDFLNLYFTNDNNDN